jgi:predicted Zn-dependent peptidase
MKMKDPQFLSTVMGYILPIGAHQDPEGKEGLSKIVEQAYKFGCKKYPDPEVLFLALENTGAVLWTNSDRESLSISISVPKENYEEAKQILDNIVFDPTLSQESFENIVTSQKMDIDQIKSDDQWYAAKTFSNALLGERDTYGTKQSLESISLGDVKKTLHRDKSEFAFIRIDGPELMQIDNPKQYSPTSDILRKQKRLTHLDRDLEQKVLMYGFSTNGQADDKYLVRKIATSILYSGLVGLTVEKIREEHSAAYYAYASSQLLSTKGGYYMGAGVSEANVVKAANLMAEIFDQVSKGEFEESRISDAKEYFKGEIGRAYDSLDTLFAYTSMWMLRGEDVPDYRQLVKDIDMVTKEQLIEFYSSVVKGNNYIVVNGSLSAENKNQLKNLIK